MKMNEIAQNSRSHFVSETETFSIHDDCHA